MKKNWLILLYLITILLLVGCKDNNSSHKTIYGGELFYHNTLIRDSISRMYIPIIAPEEIESLRIHKIVGENVDKVNIFYELTDLIENYKNNYIYFLILEIDDDLYRNKDINKLTIESLELFVNENTFEFPLYHVELKRIDSHNRGMDIIFTSTPVSIPNFEGKYILDFKVNNSIIIEDIVFTSELSISGINGTTSDKAFEESIIKGQESQWIITFNINDKNLTRYSLVNTDLIIKYRVVDTNETFWTTPPAYSSINDTVKNIKEYIDNQ